MIAKRISMRSLGKSSFENLVAYITDEQDKAERLGDVRVTNCHSNDPHWAALEVMAIQAQNTRAASDKTYHLMISLRAGENPPPEVLRAIEERICKGLGYAEHQRVSAVHRDTDNLHIHLAINKIHPVRHTLHEPYYDHKMLGELCDALEIEYGLERDNRQSRKTPGQARAADMEAHAGVESLIGWIQRECQDRIEAAMSWTELKKILHAHGLEVRRRGNGLVFRDLHGTAVKASSISRQCAKAALEARLGPFPEEQGQDPVAGAPRHYQKAPIAFRTDTAELFARYQAEQKDTLAGRSAEWQRLRDRKNRRIEAAKRAGRLQRAAVKLAASGAAARLAYSAISSSLRAELQNIQRDYQGERQRIYEKYQRLAWADWLRAKAGQGDRDALAALRAREARSGLKGDTVGSSDSSAQAGPLPDVAIDSITKKGTVIYRVEGAAIRDDGVLLKVAAGATPEGLQAALRLAMQRYGEILTVNGSDEFKTKVVTAAVVAKLDLRFEDVDLERRRLALLSNTGNLSASTAVDKYITERNSKRGTIPAIPEHKPYAASHAGIVHYAGLREVDGQALALLRKDDLILVLAVSASTVARLRRLRVGDEVTVTAGGSVRARGRSR